MPQRTTLRTCGFSACINPKIFPRGKIQSHNGLVLHNRSPQGYRCHDFWRTTAVRLAKGLSVFHRQHMAPSLAALSNSALVLVRFGQFLEDGQLSDGDTSL